MAADARPADAMILDAGPESVAQITDVFKSAKTLIWNGPLGAFEIEPFDRAMYRCCCSRRATVPSGYLISVAGGGDTVAALNKPGADKFTYFNRRRRVFRMDGGKTLPGVAALNQ